MVFLMVFLNAFYFFEKNDIMLPCPFGAGFFDLEPVDDDGVGVGAGTAFLVSGGASSSEKDSQPGS